ncbi:MAG TPA: dihydrofolate reductase [Catalimonadaceae bacterium]|jgi:dihydrofolate reductase|nr:dihydrofolate reductase [Catalimonadaceae bacterium]
MKISLIAAASTNRAIGIREGLPWHLPRDLKFFKDRTLGHHILMGRKTWETIKKALPGRITLVVSKSNLELPEGVFQFPDIGLALDFARKNGESELMVVGGGQLYEAALPIADKIYLTHVFTKVPEATAWFPPIKISAWQILDSQFYPKDEKNPFAMEFLVLKKI